MVIWRHLPFTFRVKNKNGIIPQKIGQDLQTFSGQNGGHADQINQYESINVRNFAQRVRRSKQRKLQIRVHPNTKTCEGTKERSATKIG